MRTPPSGTSSHGEDHWSFTIIVNLSIVSWDRYRRRTRRRHRGVGLCCEGRPADSRALWGFQINHDPGLVYGGTTHRQAPIVLPCLRLLGTRNETSWQSPAICQMRARLLYFSALRHAPAQACSHGEA